MNRALLPAEVLLPAVEPVRLRAPPELSRWYRFRLADAGLAEAGLADAGLADAGLAHPEITPV